MCHQSVGLLQGAIEAAGMSTIGFSVRPEVTVNMRVPRAVYVRFPTGNPVGEPHKPDQQRTLLRAALVALVAIQEPGTVIELPFRWRRMPDEDETRAESPAVPSADVYAIAQQHVGEIHAAYGQLMERLDRYRAWLQAEVDAEHAKTEPDAVKLQALGPQIKYLQELSSALEGPAHDGLVRVSDRVVRIRHWQEGVFI